MEKNKKYALITGATSGIGYELAKLFAENKYNLVIVARGEDMLDKTARELTQEYGIEVITLSKDLSDPENAFAVYEEVSEKGVTIDVLVNDAGQGQYGEFTETDIQKELAIIHLNIASLVVLTKKYLKEMVARGSGRILNVSSVASKTPGPLQSVYHGTKAFVQSFTEAIREEVKDKGVVITALLPGVTDTDFFRKADMLNAKNVKEGSKADPADVAKDGFEALMNGDDKVVSGFMNKLNVAMSNMLPETAVAANVHKQQAPADGQK